MKLKWFIWIVVICGIAAAGTWWYTLSPPRSQPIENIAVEQAKVRKVVDERSRKEETPLRAAKVAVLPPDLSKVSTDVRQILDVAADMNKRASAVNNLPPDLDAHDTAALRAFLLRPGVKDHTPFEQALKNSIMDQLCEMDDPRVRELLMKVFDDQSQDTVIRDYALQHLIESYQRAAESREGDVSRKGWEQFAELLWQAITEIDSSIAGTALLGLSRLSDVQPQFDRDHVGTAALQLAEDTVASQFARITALQVCARMGITEALPTIWQAAQFGETLSLQISAIGALGTLGQSDAKPYLNEVLKGDVEYLKPAAKQALIEIAKLEKLERKSAQDELNRQQSNKL